MNDAGVEKQLRGVFNRSTFPSGVTFQITDNVSLSLSGFKLHSSSHSSRGNMGITCTRGGQGEASQARGKARKSTFNTDINKQALQCIISKRALRGTDLLYQVDASRSLTGDNIQGAALLHKVTHISDMDPHLKVT